MTNFLHRASGALPSGQPWSVSFKTTASVTEANAETAWSNGWNAFWAESGVQALFPTGLTLTETATSTASSTFHQTTKTVTSQTFAGTGTTQCLPDHTAMVLTWETDLSTRYGHGRWYFPPPLASAMNGANSSIIGAAEVTTLVAGWSALYQALVAGSLQGILATTHAANPGGPALYSVRNVTSAKMGNKLYVQKRRGDKIIPTYVTVTL